MQKLNIYHASPTLETDELATQINIGEQLPEMDDLKLAKALYDDQAQQPAQTLLTSLPGGTVDALLVKLMQERSTLLRVPLKIPNED